MPKGIGYKTPKGKVTFTKPKTKARKATKKASDAAKRKVARKRK